MGGQNVTMPEKRKEKVFVYIVMGIYLFFLCWLILFKLADSIDKIPSMRGINLIPFHYDHDQIAGSRFHFNEVLYNAIVFIPAGFYFSALGKKKYISGIVLSALLSLSFETLQWIFALGASDITDLITNTIGGAIGAGIFFVAGKMFKGREVKIISILGAVLEILLVGMLLLLMILMKVQK